jgi:hypothetical protein
MQEDAMKRIVLNGASLPAMLLPLCLVAATVLQSRAEEPAKNEWIGKRVVPKARDFTLGAGDEGAESKVELDIWCVEKEDGPRLWVRGERLGLAGWARADQVVSVENAIAYFTSEIRDHPQDAFAFIARQALAGRGVSKGHRGLE